jgi:hypothetical protein
MYCRSVVLRVSQTTDPTRQVSIETSQKKKNYVKKGEEILCYAKMVLDILIALYQNICICKVE